MYTPTKIGFIGLGLIGGSIAKAIRLYYPETKLVAFDKNRETLALAMNESVIDVVCNTIDDNFKNCSYIFLCTPVAFNTAYLKQIQAYLHEDCILTDVGSVKTSIHEEITALNLEKYFIGGHPMAGSEKTGYSNAKAILIENAYYIITPSHSVSKEKLLQYTRFIQSLKALPVEMDYQEHDYITGAISHLPHIIASTLVDFVKNADTKEEFMKQLAAGGFKDITRIASSSPTMWQHICIQNKENISTILGKYINALQQIQSSVEKKEEDKLYDLFFRAKNYRDSVPDLSAGPIKKVFAIYCDILDETGGIATVATILASNHINLKNIGIVHNREFEEGVLRMEFYDEVSSLKAMKLLEKHRYTVYRR